MKSNDFARAAVAAAAGGRERARDGSFNFISFFRPRFAFEIERDASRGTPRRRSSAAVGARVAAVSIARARASTTASRPRASCATFARDARHVARARRRAIGARKFVATLDGCRPR